MAINPELLVAAAMMQDPFIDNSTLLPMSAGVITMYQDSSRTTLKNWYYLTGQPGAYNWLPLDNPLTLSAQGTIQDPSGNDCIPYYYPYSETDNETPQPYYVTCYDANGQLQFTRQDFPPGVSTAEPTTQVATLKNYIINNSFWRNAGAGETTTAAGTITLSSVTNSMNVYPGMIAPSNHAGFSMPDIQFMKNTTGATEVCTFGQFPLGSDPLNTIGELTPYYYINHNCSGAGDDETYKYYQFPVVLKVKNLESVQATFTICAQNVGGNPNNTLAISLYQFLGTGGGTPVTTQIGTTLSLTSNWAKYTITFTFPSSAGLTLGVGGDDAWYLQIGLPVTTTCNINFALPSLYLSTTVPTNNFTTYDMWDSIINTPRTGDYRTTLNRFQGGWVGCNNGSIGSAGSNATTRAAVDTWPLYSLIWNSVLAAYAPMVNSSGMSVSRGANAYADFSANNALFLTANLGAVIQALNGQWVTPSVFTASGGVLTITNTTFLTTGTPVLVYNNTSPSDLPSGLSANTIYYVGYYSSNWLIFPTLEDALGNSNAISANGGSNTNYITNALAATLGTSYSNALIAHTHTVSPSNGDFLTSTSGTGPVVSAANSSGNYNIYSQTGLTTSSAGSGSTFSLYQPTIGANVFLKL